MFVIGEFCVPEKRREVLLEKVESWDFGVNVEN